MNPNHLHTGCHCGAISIEVAPPTQLTVCNCSLCSRYQAMWGYYPPAEVRIEAAPGSEDGYCWGDRELEFVRCGSCGCVTHYRTQPGHGKPRIGVNFRMLVDGSVDGVPVRHFDGKNLL